MEDNNQEVVGFDIDEWKKKGEQAYVALDEKIQDIEAHIKELQEQKAEVESEKMKLGQALGLEDKPEAPKRVKIRPRVLEILEDGGEKTREEVFECLKEAIPWINRASFDESVKRMLSAEEIPLKEVSGKLSLMKAQ